MAYKNKSITNPVTGQTIRFLQTSKDTNGESLVMESSYLGSSVEPPPHYHPYQDEFFTVLSGDMTVRLDGEEMHTLERGDTLCIPRGQVHSMWNASGKPALVEWQVRPALQTEYLIETIIGLAADGHCTAYGMPTLLQMSLSSAKFSRETRVVKPSYLLQRTIFLFLRPIAWASGLRSTYAKYID